MWWWFRRGHRSTQHHHKNVLAAVPIPKTVLSALAHVPFVIPEPQQSAEHQDTLDDNEPTVTWVVSRSRLGGPVSACFQISQQPPSSWDTLIAIHRPVVQALIDTTQDLSGYNIEKAIAIRLYTLDKPKIHAELARALTGSSESKSFQVWMSFSKLLNQALHDLPQSFRVSSGILYRGVNEVLPNVRWHDLALALPIGGRCCWRPFTSTSSDKAVMMQNPAFWNPSGPRTLYIIRVKRGYRISPFSRFVENEILLPAFSRFQVVRTVQRWSQEADDQFDEVELQQL